MNYICKTLEEYLEASKKFEEYYNSGGKYISRFEFGDEPTKEEIDKCVFFEFDIMTREELLKVQSYAKENKLYNLPELCEFVLNNLGKQFEDGKLIGLEITEEDYYYILKDKEGFKVFDSCVGKLK